MLSDFFIFEVVQYAHMFGGHACRYRILLPDDETYYAAVNVYDREALGRTRTTLTTHSYATASKKCLPR